MTPAAPRWLILGIAALLVVAACGQRGGAARAPTAQDGPRAPSSAPTTAPTAPSTTVAGVTTGEEAEPKPPRTGPDAQATAPEPTPERSEAAPSFEDREPSGVVASITPSCVERPGTATVMIATVPFADVAYGASFADGNHHGQWGLGQADADGGYQWQLTVPPDAATGTATVVVSAGHPEGGGGPGRGSFVVAEPGGC